MYNFQKVGSDQIQERFFSISFVQVEIMEFTSEDKEKIEPVHIRDRTLMFQFSDSWVVHEVQDDSTADDEWERLLKETAIKMN